MELQQKAMGFRKDKFALCFVALFCLWTSACGLFSPGVNLEVQALMGIKYSLVDPHGVLDNWYEFDIDPCSWNMVTCSPDGLVIGLGAPSQNLSGALAPTIGNLTNLQQVLLQNNSITGHIPSELGNLPNLQTFDLSNNYFSGQIPSSLSNLKSLQYLRLNNNSLSGAIPPSMANMTQLKFVDLSFNNLSGPAFLPKTFINLIGNPLICAMADEQNCSRTGPIPMSSSSNSSQSNNNSHPSGRWKGHEIILALASTLGCICLIFIGFAYLLWWRQRHNEPSLFDANAKSEVEESVRNLKRFSFEELVIATNNFSSKKLLGKGGFGNVYKGTLRDGTVVAIKRLKDGNAAGGETQFQAEVKIISLALHRNLLQLYGFCMTGTERLLVYPFMSNGSVATRLRARPTLDWGTRKRIVLGTVRALLYLHEQCDPKIIHRDVKAANVLLDDQLEPVVGDFGLVKLMEHRDSHVTTAVRGTIGYIAPEYLSTGHFSDKTDVFAFGIFLLELVTGKRPSAFGGMFTEERAMIDWVNNSYKEKRFDGLVDEGLENKYDQMEVDRMIKLSLSCTQYHPNLRPNMCEVLQIMEENKLTD